MMRLAQELSNEFDVIVFDFKENGHELLVLSRAWFHGTLWRKVS